MSEIKVISSCLVRTTRDISMPKLELNTWDVGLLITVYSRRGLIFQNPKSKQTLIDHLKNSLSRTLDFFPPLAGRLATTAHDGDMSRFFIDCNNAGAHFTHAAAAAISVSDILESNSTSGFISSLFPLGGIRAFEGVSEPLLAVQVTELDDGVFIGCAANHAVMDGASQWHFINSWSEISRGCDTISKLPVFERWFPSGAAAGVDKRLVHLPTLKNRAFVEFSTPHKIFHFSKESLAKLKAKANSEAGTHKISTLQALIAHLWRSTTRCGGRSSGESCIAMSIGARARLPLPDGYFGNAFYTPRFVMSESDLLQRGLGYAALKIHEFVSQQTREAIIRSVEEDAGLLRRPAVLMIGSSPQYDVYGNDFGWGRPIALRCGSSNVREGSVRAWAAAEAGGVDLEVCLAEEMLNALECDAEFMGVV